MFKLKEMGLKWSEAEKAELYGQMEKDRLGLMSHQGGRDE